MMPGDDTPLRAFTGYRLLRTNSAAMSRMHGIFAKFGLRRTTFSTLSLVVATPGQRQGQVAKALAIERPNFVQIIDELEKVGLINRITAKDDRRAYALHATPKGVQVYEDAARAVQRCDKELTQGLSTRQIEDLYHALDVIARNSSKEETQDDL